MLPDLSLYVLAGVSLFFLQISPQRVFGELYYSPLWQGIFAVDNSAVLWGGLFALSFFRKWRLCLALSGAALLHIATDFPLHHDDGRAHFWPLSDWIFASPLSYWDSAHHAAWVAPATLLLSITSAIVLWRRFPGLVGRLGVLVLLGLEIWVARQWILFF
ncbi:cobalamin biosynthesis protein CobQ [Primorskyibacter sp. S187A]|uniref:cobalamin biosynthesis protein CobQ n=1 Tax=Primorskyibacter sp. S187A TaxID=3415130 RepID=UPI003C7DD640